MDFEAARARLVQCLSAEIRDTRVLGAMSRIPRESFVPLALRDSAYEDMPLPIGSGQTISQPFMVALMTQELELEGGEKVLEVGTGSGYQAAILAELARRVITTERLPALIESARLTLDTLGYGNIELHLAEETLGWWKEAPYDAIIVTAGAPDVPPDLLAQLAIGGRMVIPVGDRDMQGLCKITRGRKRNTVENLTACCFVPLVGRGAWPDEDMGDSNGCL